MDCIESITRDLQSQGYSLQYEVLSKTQLSHIQKYFFKDFEQAMVGTGTNRQRIETVRGDYTFWLDPKDPPKDFQVIIELLDQLKSSCNQRLFLGLKEYECHLAKYLPGTFYQKHSDRFNNDSSRALTFIFYLNSEWSEEFGGELVIYDKKGEVVKSILPEPGLMVCFLPGDFPHEVKVCHRERRSLTGWMHTKIIY